MFFHRPNVTSTNDSAESIATPPPESDLDDEQIRNMLASPLYLQESEVSADRPRVCHSFGETSVSSSAHFRESAGKPATVFSHKKSSQETIRDRGGISSEQQTVQGKGESFFRFSDPEETVRWALEDVRGVNSAKDSSFGGVPVVNCLGVVGQSTSRSGKRRARDRRDTRKGTKRGTEREQTLKQPHT